MTDVIQINDHCCLHCEHLIWWDGDYVCIKKCIIKSGQTDDFTCFPSDVDAITKPEGECFKNDENHIWDKLIEEIKNKSNENNALSTLA